MKSLFSPVLRVTRHSKLSSNSYLHQRLIFTVNPVSDFVPKNEGQLTENVIKEKLSSLAVNFNDGYTCLHLKECNLCSTKARSASPALYLNKRTGFFFCNQCKISGNWSTFLQAVEQMRGKNPNKNFKLPEHSFKRYEENWKNIVKNSTPITELDDKKYEEVQNNFKLNFYQRSDFDGLEARISKDSGLLYFPLYSNKSVVGYKILSSDGKSVTYPSTECTGFICTHGGKNTAVVVAEIQDFLALASQNLKMEILCLPYGTSVLPQSCLPFMEKFEKIILWLGGIEALDATSNFANKLNSRRCHIVKPIDNQKSAHYAVAKKENIHDILLNSKSAFHEYIITFSSLREEVLAQFQNKEQCAGVQWQRFPELNQILKGHRRGELTILTGPTGSGKTTFISEYSLDLAMKGVNTLWGSFEIKNSHLAKKMIQQFCKLPLENHLEKFNNLADEFEKLPIFFMSFHGQQELSSVMDAVEHCSYVYDIAHVIIDNVQFMIDIEPDNTRFDRFFKQDILIQKFRKFATEHNCHVTLVMHPRKGLNETDLGINSIFGGVKATQEADNILIIQNRKLNSFFSKKVLQVEKNRYCGDLGVMSLEYDKLTHCFSKNLKVKKCKDLIVKQSLGICTNKDKMNETFYRSGDDDDDYDDEESSFREYEERAAKKSNQHFE